MEHVNTHTPGGKSQFPPIHLRRHRKVFCLLKQTPLKRPNACIGVYSLQFTSSQVLFTMVRRRRSVALLRWRRQLSGPNRTSTKCAAGADHRVECGYNPSRDRGLQQVAEVSGWMDGRMDGWMDGWMGEWAQPTPSLLGDGFAFLFIAWLACPFFRGGECTRLQCVILRFHEKPTLP